jgi:hypothetical protein
MPCIFAARGLQCCLPARRCPASARAGRRAPPWPVVPRARTAPAHPAAPGMPGARVDHLLNALQPEAGGAVTFGVAADAMSQGSAGRQDGQ